MDFKVNGKNVGAWQVAKLLATKQTQPGEKVRFRDVYQQLGNARKLIKGENAGGMTRQELDTYATAFVGGDRFLLSKPKFSQSKYDQLEAEKSEREVQEANFNEEHYWGEEYENPLFNGDPNDIINDPFDPFLEDFSEEEWEYDNQNNSEIPPSVKQQPTVAPGNTKESILSDEQNYDQQTFEVEEDAQPVYDESPFPELQPTVTGNISVLNPESFPDDFGPSPLPPLPDTPLSPLVPPSSK
ncbi:MAG: hypothetical protein LW808_002050 [Verrucomicrobiota bacterium]|nr:MAG: hypothetical protein LW808_002050 [Verrucomicrobiota bacterium]